MPRSLVLQFGIALHSHGFGSTLRGSSWVCPYFSQFMQANCAAPAFCRPLTEIYPTYIQSRPTYIAVGGECKSVRRSRIESLNELEGK